MKKVKVVSKKYDGSRRDEYETYLYAETDETVVSQLTAGNSNHPSVAEISQKSLLKSHIWQVRPKKDLFFARSRLFVPCSAPHFSLEAGEKRRKQYICCTVRLLRYTNARNPGEDIWL